MSDQFDALFGQLRGQTPPAPFAPAEAVRRRGRQRAHRQAVSVGVAVLAVTGVGAGSVVTLAGDRAPAPPASTGAPTTTAPTPGPSSPATPARTRIPPQWLLSAADLGPGQWVTGFEPEWTESDPPWLWGDLCPGYQAADYPSLATRVDLVSEAWTDGPWTGEPDGPPPNWVHQVVELFQPGAAEANLRDVRAVVDRCARAGQVEHEIVADGFAGDESVLVAERGPEDLVAYTAVVRVGPAVTSLRSYDVELARADDGYLRSVAARAADRLR